MDIEYYITLQQFNETKCSTLYPTYIEIIRKQMNEKKLAQMKFEIYKTELEVSLFSNYKTKTTRAIINEDDNYRMRFLSNPEKILYSSNLSIQKDPARVSLCFSINSLITSKI